MEERKANIIELSDIIEKLWRRKTVFFKTLPIVFLLACAYIVCIPRYYTTEIALAPETESLGSGGALGSIASSFGFDLSGLQSTDAITPLLYPDLMDDNGFISKLFSTPVETQDGTLKTDYYDYMKNHQQKAWWSNAFSSIASALGSDEDDEPQTENKMDPYHLTKQQDKLIKKIKGNFVVNVDKKTGVITIAITDQDPLICKTMGDSLTTILQAFITDYRTSKSRLDVAYYEDLTRDAKKRYEEIRQRYVQDADANTDVILESVRAKVEDLENDMQLKWDTYSTMQAQLEAAKAKVRERTPVFTILKGAAVPVKPSGPKRMIFVIAMTMLAFIADSFYIIQKEKNAKPKATTTI